MVLDYIYFRSILGIGGPTDTSKIESILVQKMLNEKTLRNLIDDSWKKTLAESPDRYKWKEDKTLVVNEIHKTLLLTEEYPICKLTYKIDNYKEFNAVALKWDYPANGPIRSHETAFNHYFNLAIHEYLFK
jgi:hypothetical protein